MPTWPASLPDDFLQSGFSETLPDNVLRSKMDIGPPKTRRRSTAAPRPIAGQQLMTTAQVATFDTFFVTTLSDGAIGFDWTHPRTGAAITLRFVSPPAYVATGGDFWSITLPLEVLP